MWVFFLTIKKQIVIIKMEGKGNKPDPVSNSEDVSKENLNPAHQSAFKNGELMKIPQYN